MQINVYFVGTAGSGKTFFTKAFAEWLDLKKLDYMIINLDPGAEYVPYSADFDVREYYTLEDIMHRYKVGPNGAQIIGADMIATIIDELKYEIEYSNSEYILIDTPGQMELFTLRESSRMLVNSLGAKNSVMVFLFDPIVSKTPNGYLSLLFMSSSAVFRLEMPQIPVLAKSDILSDQEIEMIKNWSSNPDSLLSKLVFERKTLSSELFAVLKEVGFFRPLIPASAITGAGIEDVYDGIQEIFYSGEDLERILF
ncbi:MAG: ATP/GTP-binding protein [Archaeoglobaceae archaeon]